jgi:hypothetical protein
MGLVVFTLALTASLLVLTNERFQRITSLNDSGRITGRIYGSVNERFIEYLIAYPLGAGMGSSAGTSIPYFLASKAPKKVGLENEYCRILIDQGWIGLLLWGGFIIWVHWPPPKIHNSPSTVTMAIAYAVTLTTWATAALGTGLLVAVPSGTLLLIQMGIIVARRSQEFAVPPRVSRPSLPAPLSISPPPKSSSEHEWHKPIPPSSAR